MLLEVLLLLLAPALAQERWGHIEPSYTLRNPYQDYAKYWKVGGSATIDDFGLHFQPQSKKTAGYAWSNLPVTMTSWEVLLEFNQHGMAPLSTGEGMAFWHVANPTYDQNGPVYGHTDQFSGLGIFFDSYDADGNGIAETYVLAMYNSGEKPIDAEGAGKQLGVCFADYRNIPYPARAKITYDGAAKSLSVLLDVENSGSFKNCFVVKDLTLNPDREFFGLTVSDYGSDSDVASVVGINISVKPPADENEKDMVKVDAGNVAGSGYESHTHFHRIEQRLIGLTDRLAVLESQFGKQFDAVFNNHHKGLEFHTTKLQGDMHTKHVATHTHLESLVTSIDSLQSTVGWLQSSIANAKRSVVNTNQGPDDRAESLAKVKISCISDNHRSSTAVSQLTSFVSTLSSKQEEIFQDVKRNIEGIRTNVGGCGSSVFPSVALILGFVIGAFVVSGSGRKRSHLP